MYTLIFFSAPGHHVSCFELGIAFSAVSSLKAASSLCFLLSPWPIPVIPVCLVKPCKAHQGGLAVARAVPSKTARCGPGIINTFFNSAPRSPSLCQISPGCFLFMRCLPQLESMQRFCWDEEVLSRFFPLCRSAEGWPSAKPSRCRAESLLPW